jgi:hypothetical protein
MSTPGCLPDRILYARSPTAPMSKINPDRTLHIQRCCVYFAKKPLHSCSVHFTKTPLTQHHWMWRVWSGLILLMGAVRSGLILLMGAAGLLAHRIRSPGSGTVRWCSGSISSPNAGFSGIHLAIIISRPLHARDNLISFFPFGSYLFICLLCDTTWRCEKVNLDTS